MQTTWLRVWRWHVAAEEIGLGTQPGQKQPYSATSSVKKEKQRCKWDKERTLKRNFEVVILLLQRKRNRIHEADWYGLKNQPPPRPT